MRTASALVAGALLVATSLVAPGSAAAAPVAQVGARAASTVSTASVQEAWAKSFAALEKKLPGTAGVSVAPIGRSGWVTIGSWRSGVAWSTSKVPLSAAALRRSPSSSTKSLVKRAITVSDNAAAEALWERLGTPTTAAKRVQAVIRDSGDQHTVMQSRVVRPGFTAFGQTHWTSTNQARFAAGFACRSEARPVLKLMGQITTSQRWGLGHVKGAQFKRTQFKGGWGPIGSGYLVRQLGVVTLSDGRMYGVSIGVWSPDGFTRGTQDLTRVATWLQSHLAQLPAGHC